MKSKTKGGLGLVLVLCLAMTLLAGCGSSGQTASAPAANDSAPAASGDVVTIRVMSSDDFAGFRTSVIKEFEDANPGIKIDFQSVGYDALHQKEVTALAAGSDTYDIVDVDCIWTPEYVTNGYIVCVDDRLTDEMKTGIAPVAMDTLAYEGKIYGLPMFNDLFFMFYNKDILGKAGLDAPPATWDEFTAACNKMQEDGLIDYGSAWGWAQAEGLICYYMTFLKGYGGSLVDDNHNPTVNTPENVAALQYMVDSLYDSKISAPASVTSDDRMAIDLFSQGKTPFVINWSFAWSVFNDPEQSAVADKVGVMLVPGTNGIKSATCAGSMGLSITSTCQHKDEAWKFIEFLASKEIQKRQAIEAGALPIWEELYSDPKLIEQHPALKEMLEQVGYAYNRPSLVWYNEFSDALQVEVQNALTQSKTPQQALDDAQAKALEIQKKY